MNRKTDFTIDARLLEALNMLPEAACCFDHQGNILALNQIATSLPGDRFYVGQNLQDICTIRLDFPSFLQALEANGRGYTHIEMIDDDGHGIIYRFSARAIPSEEAGHYCAQIIPLPVSDTNVHYASHYEVIFQNLGDAIFLAPLSPDGVHGNFVDVNNTACQRLGYTRDELLGMNARSLNPEANISKVKAYGRQINREKSTIFSAIHVTASGTQIPVEVAARLITINNQDYVLSHARDLRETQKLDISESRIGRLLDQSWQEIYIIDVNTLRFMQANQGARDNLGYSNNEINELRLTDLLKEISETEFHELAQPLLNGKKGQVAFEATLTRKNGTVYPAEFRIQLSVNEVPPLFLATAQDITERKKIETRLQLMANYDMLTGLPNRALLIDRLNVALENSRRTSTLAAVLFVDLDGFKKVNDTLGHDAGDSLIKEVSHRVKSIIRKSDTVARLGGDEFIIILTNIKSVNGVETASRKILDTVKKPVLIEDTPVAISASIGITLYPLDDNTSNAYELIKQADTAMYQAKEAGKNQYCYYTRIAADDKFLRTKMDEAIKFALENNQLQILYQPRINLETNQLSGAEALLRWHHPELGKIYPTDFIPIMESNGVIREVGSWLIKQTCLQIKNWSLSGYNYKVSVNVSARQFDDDSLPQLLKTCLEDNGISPEYLQIEITEGLLISESERATENLNQIKSMGIKIAMDDFGSGYSSLNYLRQFPIDIIKIDKSFIHDLFRSDDSSIIIDAIIALAEKLSIHVIAEGIETREQRDFLREHGCKEGQGFYFSKAITPAALPGLKLK